MKHILILPALLMLSNMVAAQTIIVDYTEKTLEKEYVIHYLAASADPKSMVYEDITSAKKELLGLIEGLQKDGFELTTSTISSHKHWRWFKKGMHYHYQYVLQNGRSGMRPVLPGRDMGGQPPNDQKRQMRRPGSRQGGGQNGGGRSGKGGGSMNHGSPGGGGSQGAPPPPPPLPPGGDEQSSPEGAPPSGGGGNMPPPRPTNQGKQGGDASDGKKVPEMNLGSQRTGPK